MRLGARGNRHKEADVAATAARHPFFIWQAGNGFALPAFRPERERKQAQEAARQMHAQAVFDRCRTCPVRIAGLLLYRVRKGHLWRSCRKPRGFAALFAARLPRPFRVRTKQAWLLRALNGFRVCGHAHAAEPLRFRQACSRRKGTGIAPRFIFRLALEARAPTAFSPPSQRFCPPVRSSRR